MAARQPLLVRALAPIAAVLLAGTALALEPDKAITQYHYEVWNTDDGLPQISVQDIIQTRDGYLWMGTQEGLARFDGVRFVVYDTRNTEAIRNNYITELLEARDGSIWIGTYGGGALRLRDGEFTAFTEEGGLPSDIVHAMVESAGGDIWIGTEGGLARHRDGALDVYRTEDGLPHNLVQALFVDDQSTLWIGTRGGGIILWRMGQFVAPPAPLTLPTDLVSALFQSADGAIWIGTQGQGVFRLTDDQLSHIGAAEGLTSQTIFTIRQDRHGSIWIGTYDGGICRLTDGTVACLTPDEGLSHQHVTSIQEDSEGNLWFGTLGGGLNRLRDAKFTSYTPLEGLSHPGTWAIREGDEGLWIGTESGLDLLVDGHFVSFPGQAEASDDSLMAIHEDADGTLWTGMYGGGMRHLVNGRWTSYSTANELADDQVFCITRDGDGALWIGTRSGLNRLAGGEIATFTTEHGLPHDNIKALHVDARGVLWIGTRGGGIARYQYGEFTAFEPQSGLTPNQKMVYAIHEEADGTLWFGTLGGLIRYRDGESAVFTVADGLFDDTSYAILEDDQGFLWMSCNRGVYRVSKSQLNDRALGRIGSVETTPFGQADGMPSSECNGGSQPAGFKTSDGRLWFPTIAGLASIDPTTIRRNEVKPPVLIESVVVDTHHVDPDEKLVFPPGRKRMEFQFAALSLTAAEQVRFKYRLIGVDRTWSEETKRREAVYSSIPQGDYTFQVIACNNDGIWNEVGDSFVFRVQPYFYETRLFIAACLLALVGLVALTHGMRIRQLKQRADQLSEAVDARTRELRTMTEELKELSLRDPLTGLRNRRFLFETLASVMANLARQRARQSAGSSDRRGLSQGDVVGLFMVDIDYFKQVNDTHGHDAGDAVLRQFASVLLSCVRAEDTVVRWGGEEFLVVLPHTRYGTLDEFAERVRYSVESTDFEIGGGKVLHKTCSVGFTSFPFTGDAERELTLEQVITVADLALYRAKRDGRNRTVHVIAGRDIPSDPDDVALTLSDLDWALQKSYLEIVETQQEDTV